MQALRHADTVCWFGKVSVLCVGLNFERAVRVDRFVLRGVSARHASLLVRSLRVESYFLTWDLAS